MAEPFLGQIILFAGNFAPRSYAFCDGQLLSIAQHDALYSLLGTIYGGDGQTTFALPDLRGRVPLHQGAGPGLSQKAIGQKAGVEQSTLGPGELPSHTHALQVSSALATDANPSGRVLAEARGDDLYGEAPDVQLANTSVTPTGAGQPHTNMQSYTALNYCIALFGIYPSRF